MMSRIARWCVPDGAWNTQADRLRILDDHIAAGWWELHYLTKRQRLALWRVQLVLDAWRR